MVVCPGPGGRYDSLVTRLWPAAAAAVAPPPGAVGITVNADRLVAAVAGASARVRPGPPLRPSQVFSPVFREWTILGSLSGWWRRWRAPAPARDPGRRCAPPSCFKPLQHNFHVFIHELQKQFQATRAVAIVTLRQWFAPAPARGPGCRFAPFTSAGFFP